MALEAISLLARFVYGARLRGAQVRKILMLRRGELLTPVTPVLPE